MINQDREIHPKQTLQINNFNLTHTYTVSDDGDMEMMNWLVDNSPKSRLQILESTGHFPFIKAAVEFKSSVASFLSR